MITKALWAAAAVVVAGVGAVDAATVVKDYNLHLRYEGTDFHDVSYVAFDADGNRGDDMFLDRVTADDAPSWMKSYAFPNLPVGSIIGFISTVIFTDEVTYDEGGFPRSGSAPECRIGTVTCTSVNFNRLSESGVNLETSPDGEMWLSFNPVVGGDFEFGLWMPAWGSSQIYVEDGITYHFSSMMQFSNFKVVSATDIAPVPLPASAALLPMGVAALALMRRRRRK